MYLRSCAVSVIALLKPCLVTPLNNRHKVLVDCDNKAWGDYINVYWHFETRPQNTCVFLFGQQCHRNSEWTASNLELLIGLAFPHVTEQVPAGLSNTSCCSQHCLSGLCKDDITTLITVAWPVCTQASMNYLKQTSGSENHHRKPFCNIRH